MIRIKTEQEINGIRRSCQLLSRVFSELGAKVVPGITPLELDEIAQKLITDAGGRPSFLGYNGFPAALCVSVNNQVIHGVPGKKPVSNGDIVGLDLGIDLSGYFSDMAETFAVGKIAPRTEKLLAACKEALYLGIAKAKKGNRVKDISRAIFAHAKINRLGVVREFCGHGVGLDVHESPSVHNFISPGPSPRLKNGMVLALEPMFNLGGDGIKEAKDGLTIETKDGSLSAHFEHTILIAGDEPEILTLK